MLSLDARVVRVALRGAAAAAAAGGGEADVLVVAHGLLGETAEHLVLLSAEALHPAVHVLEHLALDLGVAVVEVRVEA